ncbi:MAG: hypothetical protein IKM55_00105 [Bacilli bacterium]|jgi:hypothetical protein|nr:hypothetical protein [Bacilli bacterium]
MDIGVSVQRAEDIEKRMDELEQELNSLDNCEDRKYAKKRTKEILKESRKLTMELMKAVSKFAKKNKLIDKESQDDLDGLIEDRKTRKTKKEK